MHTGGQQPSQPRDGWQKPTQRLAAAARTHGGAEDAIGALTRTSLLDRLDDDRVRVHRLVPRVLAIFEAVYGPDHPQVARALDSLGKHPAAVGGAARGPRQPAAGSGYRGGGVRAGAS